MLESPKFIENDLYDGSRMFTWLADAVGLSVDLVSFSFVAPLPPWRTNHTVASVRACVCVYF